MKRLSALIILAFSCFFAVAQSISVVSPNGGEVWDIGTSQNITWSSSGVAQVNIEVSEDNGLTWSLLGTVNATPAGFTWNVSGSGTMQARVRITDAGNNTVTDVSDGAFIIGPQAVVDAGPDAVICFGTSTQLNATGMYYSGSGSPAPTYMWSPSAGLSNANIPNPVASPAVTTVYTVTVEYGGVQSVDDVTITVDNPIAGITLVNPIYCYGGNDGQICASVTGGSGGNTYLWNTGSTSSCQTNLSAGNYILSVIDGMGCSDSASITLSDPMPLFISFTTTNASCNGAANGSICAVVSGSTAPYAFSWSNGATTSCLSNLVAGSYTITVASSSGCTATATTVVNQPAALNVSLNTVNPSCNGATNGSITATVTGGTPAYMYSWSNGVNVPAVVGPLSGTYTLTVTDMNGCTVTASATVNQPAPINITITGVDVTCNGLSNGQLCSSVTGGVTPYTYMWDMMGTTPCFTNIPIGTYQLIVTDANGCTATSAGTVLQQSNLQDSIVVSGGGCSGPSGTICVYPYGGAGAVSYAWSDGQTLQCPTGLPAGTTFFVTVTDALNCQLVDSAQVPANGSLAASVNTVNLACNSIPTGIIEVIVTSGTAPYEFSIDGGLTFQSSNMFTGLSAGVYNISVTDAGTCSFQDIITLAEPSALMVNITSATAGVLPDTLMLTVTGGTPPYSYNWSDGQVIHDIIVATAGTYTVTVTDVNACSITAANTAGCNGLCVWPGDADYDGLVNNNDLLAIGIGYGTSGPSRTLQDINWYAHQSQDWADTLSSGSNFKHIDCDGNGIIDSDDTLAIIQNYALTHVRSGSDEWRGGLPELRIVMVPDTLADGETIVAHLSLGDALMPANNVYALAFTFNFDPLVVDSTAVSITFDSNSWLCNSAADHLDIDKVLYQNGRIETALTRIDHTNRSGNGEIGSVSMKITTGNINGKTLAHYAMNCFISDLVVIDNQGNHLAVNAGADSAVVEYEPTGFINLSQTSALNLYPNPAKDELIVNAGELNIQQVSIFDNVGQQVANYYGSGNAVIRLDVSSLAEGLYFIKAFGKTGSARGHFIKAR